MRGMILAAGRGERMGALTAEIPKPLIKIADRYLIEYSISALKKMGVKEIVINLCYLGEKIKHALGDGERYGVHFHYSEETDMLGTGGGILKALPLLGKDPFVVVSADVITDFPFHTLSDRLSKNLPALAHVVLVDNPSFHQAGDFSLEGNRVVRHAVNPFTFASMGIYRPELFQVLKLDTGCLGQLLLQEAATSASRVTGEHYQGVWHNVGTPQELARCDVPSLHANF